MVSMVLLFSIWGQSQTSISVDECGCLNNASTPYDGQFAEKIAITGPASENWALRYTSGLYQATSPAPPAPPTPFYADYPFTEVSPGMYELDAVRITGTEWQAVVINLTTNMVLDTIKSTKLCRYPSTDIVGDKGTCIGNVEVYTTAIPASMVNNITWSVPSGGSIVSGQGTPEITVDWGNSVGKYPVSFSGTAAAYPGQTSGFCNFSGVDSVAIMDEQAFPIACNNLLNISLSGECFLDVTPDMILEDMQFTNDSYDIILRDIENDEIIPGTTMGMEYINKVIEVKVVHECSGNSCWGNLKIEDKSIPQLDCPPLTIIDCDQSILPAITGFPVADTLDVTKVGDKKYSVFGFDKCSEVFLTYSDSSLINDVCDGPYSAKIRRRWYATDISSNMTSCDQFIYVNKATLDDIVFPGNWDDQLGPNPTIEACTNYPTLPNGYPDPAYTGEPQGVFCLNVRVEYEDTPLPICGDKAVKIVRSWTITDLCTGQQKKQNQSITIMDTTPPVCQSPPDFTVGTSPTSCSSTIEVPPPIVTNECSDWTYSVYYKIPDGSGNPLLNPINDGVVAHADGYIITGLDQVAGDKIWIVYYVKDACDNISQCFTEVTINDTDQPIPVCDQHTFVGLDEDGEAHAGINAFDDGSWDNCGIDYMEIRRLDGYHCGHSNAFSDIVHFCCDDVGKTIMVELRVVDRAGNSNSCMVEAEVQDNTPPVFTFCPPDTIIDCVSDIDHLDQYGLATAEDNCDVTITQSRNDFLNGCGVGYIRRTFTATDGQGNSSTCIQRIEVRPLNPFGLNHISWPGNVLVTNGCKDSGVSPDDLPPGKQRPILTPVGCSQVAMDYDDEIFQYTDEACFKILRKWTVIDWCVPNPTLGHGKWTYTQLIKVHNETPPTFSVGCNADDYVIAQTASCSARVLVEAMPEDDCTPIEDMDVIYKIDEDNNGTIDFTGTGRILDRIMSFGTHRIIWEATDECGNVGNCAAIITIKDTKKPTPYCYTEIVTATMSPSGSVTIWASDFDAGSFDNCTDQDNLTLSLSPNTNVTSATFTCADIDSVITYVPMKLYVTDEEGNQDFCTITLKLQDNQDVCGNGLNEEDETKVELAGRVVNGNNDAFQDVEVNITASLPEYHLSTYTDETGRYAFSDLPMNEDYRISPKFESSYNEGVSTLDLVLIQRHILELKKFDNPYTTIAADVNNSGNVSASDLVVMRKLILGIISEFPDSPSWRFVDKGQTFADPNNPFPYQENIEMDGLNQDYFDANMVAIKVGDVNYSSEFNLAGKNISDTRSTTTLFGIDQYLEPGIHEVRLALDGKKDVIGYQMDLAVNQALVNNIELKSSSLPIENNEYYYSNGILKIAVSKGVPADVNDEFVTIILDVKARGYVSEMISLRTMGIPNEIYLSSEGQIQTSKIDLALNRESIDSERTFQLLQNVPNPFNASTDIGFVLPEAQEVSLRIMDLTGKVILSKKGYFPRGLNSITINVNEMNASGVLYYQLETQSNSATKKMIILK